MIVNITLKDAEVLVESLTNIIKDFTKRPNDHDWYDLDPGVKLNGVFHDSVMITRKDEPEDVK